MSALIARGAMETHLPPPAAQPVAKPALLTKVQLAGELQCSPRHVERLQRERKIPVIRLSARCVRYSRERVLLALARGCEQEAIA